MSLFYSSRIVTDNALVTRQGRNPQEVPNQRQQDERLTNYPFGAIEAGQVGANNVPQAPRSYDWPQVFPTGSNWFRRARAALAREYLHGNYELARPGATPGWPIGDRYTIYTRLRPVATKAVTTAAPNTPRLGTAPAGFEYGSPYDW